MNDQINIVLSDVVGLKVMVNVPKDKRAWLLLALGKVLDDPNTGALDWEFEGSEPFNTNTWEVEDE